MIYIGADHAGYNLKEKIKHYLEQKSVSFIDVGAKDLDTQDDYTDYGYMVGERVAKNPRHRGILLCGNAQGICITANKIKGIRAVTGYSVYAAQSSREDDNANVLCLPGRVLREFEAVRIVQKWLDTPFSGAGRHKRRLKKLEVLEKTGKITL